jgi:undecaprenyl-diphosphatase
MSHHLTYAEAVVTGLVQGVTEVFPVSSLGHNVLLPALIGGSWAKTLDVTSDTSPYLAFVVGLHVATALAMIAYFWRDWLRIIGGFFSSVRRREITTADQRLAWMIILATIPVGIVGAGLQKVFTHVFAKPTLTAAFLAVNGLILLYSERQRRAKEAARAVSAASAVPAAVGGSGWDARDPWGAQAPEPSPGRRAAQPASRAATRRHAAPREQHPRAAEIDRAVASDRRLSAMGYGRAVGVGTAQILALLPGISRDGIVTVAGMWRGLSRGDAVRYSFLLSAPVILAAGALKAHDLSGPLGKGIHGPVLAGSLLSFIGAYLSVRFLTRYFSEERSLNPFGIYCLIAGLGSLVYLLIR